MSRFVLHLVPNGVRLERALGSSSRRLIMRMKWLAAGVVLAGAALPGLAQQQIARPTHIKIGQPTTAYTAEFKITRAKTLADGGTITHESSETRAADSHGRTMTATTTRHESGEETTITRVFDPTAGTRTWWTTPGQQAIVTVVQGGAPPSCAPGEPQAPSRDERRISSSQDLGTDAIDGVEARGRRVTTHESWMATTIHPTLIVREISDDPAAGKTTLELTSLSLSEPEASLFEPPQGYEVVRKEQPPAPCPVTAPGGLAPAQ